ncbi:MAG: lipocalin family protein [Fibrobacter sp.]|nr:lipocalin family protein [Fibrobacter sp.]
MQTLLSRCRYFLLLSGSFFALNIFAVDVIKELDYDQYSGTWYEIARFPNKHEKGMVEVTSTFKRRKDGRYEIINEGYKGSRGGKKTSVKGLVQVPDPKIAGNMKIRVWFFTIDYRVIDVDKENYEYALVTSESDRYLWIFCKSPFMDPDVYEKLVASAREKGFDTDRLERVPQDANCAIVERQKESGITGS